MAAFRFTKIPKPNRFEYKTRFLDLEKEELQKRLRRIESLENGDATTEEVKMRIQSAFKTRGSRSQAERSFRSSQARRSNIILLAVIIMLSILAYYVVNYNLPGLMKLLEMSNSAN